MGYGSFCHKKGFTPVNIPQISKLSPQHAKVYEKSPAFARLSLIFKLYAWRIMPGVLRTQSRSLGYAQANLRAALASLCLALFKRRPLRLGNESKQICSRFTRLVRP